MSLFRTVDQTEYPETDGRPMGETDLHVDWMVRIRDILRLRYRDQRVYVGSNLIIYYEEGTPSRYVVPDGFVVLDCDPHRRRTYKLWEEGRPPDVVFEVTSRSSKREDEIFKPPIYAQIAVAEYFVYDPGAEYLDPPLQGFRLEGEGYRRIEPDAHQRLRSERLGITLGRDGDDLVMWDMQSGQRQLTAAEAERAARRAEEVARRAEEAARRAEEAARKAAESRAEQLEAELERLRAELRARRSD